MYVEVPRPKLFYSSFLLFLYTYFISLSAGCTFSVSEITSTGNDVNSTLYNVRNTESYTDCDENMLFNWK